MSTAGTDVLPRTSTTPLSTVVPVCRALNRICTKSSPSPRSVFVSMLPEKCRMPNLSSTTASRIPEPIFFWLRLNVTACFGSPTDRIVGSNVMKMSNAPSVRPPVLTLRGTSNVSSTFRGTSGCPSLAPRSMSPGILLTRLHGKDAERFNTCELDAPATVATTLASVG